MDFAQYWALALALADALAKAIDNAIDDALYYAKAKAIDKSKAGAPAQVP